MKQNKILKTGALLALCLTLAPVTVFAEENGMQAEQTQPENRKTLTYRTALNKALENSTSLKNLQTQASTSLENRRYLWRTYQAASAAGADHDQLMQIWQSVEALDLSESLKEENEALLKDSTEAMLKSYFAAIANDEATLKIATQNVQIKQTQLEQGERKYELGLISENALTTLRSDLAQAELSAQMRVLQVEQDYMNLNRLMGEDDLYQKYNLEYELDMGPMEVPYGDLDTYVKNAVRSDTALKIQKQNLEYQEGQSFYANDSASRKTAESEYEVAERNYEAAQEDKALAIRKAYLQIRQLEASYESAKDAVAQAEQLYHVAEVNYAAGNATQLAVEQAALAVEQAKSQLIQLEHNYDLLVFSFDNTCLLGSTSA